MNLDSRIYVAGHRGLVGSAIVRRLQSEGYKNIETRTSRELDLREPELVRRFFMWFKPEYVFLAAAHVGGIKDNRDHPLGFFLDNMAIETNVITMAAEYRAKKLLFLGSSCIYPRDCPQPIKEEYLLTGPYEKTTEAYALAKTAGIRLCQWLHQKGHNFVSAMPCNLFGLGDDTDPERAHIIPSLIARLHAAKIRKDPEFFVWGDGTAKREFLFADDLADALMVVMDKYDEEEHINTGSGFELPVAATARIVAGVVGYQGEIKFDPTQPVGTPRKILDNSKIEALGWKPKTSFVKALHITYQDFLSRT